MNLFCKCFWHDYKWSFSYPPTKSMDKVMSMTDHVECRRCGHVKSHVEWSWDDDIGDFYSNEKGWLINEDRI